MRRRRVYGQQVRPVLQHFGESPVRARSLIFQPSRGSLNRCPQDLFLTWDFSRILEFCLVTDSDHSWIFGVLLRSWQYLRNLLEGIQFGSGGPVVEIFPGIQKLDRIFERRNFISWFAKRLLLLDLGILIGVVLCNILVFGQRMGKDKGAAQEHHHDPQPMPDPALAL